MKKLIEKLFSYQGIRFLFVGGLNTIVGYGVYALLIYLNVNYLLANTISTAIGIAHSYLWNRFFTFKSKDKALGEITKFVSVYFSSYLIGMLTLYIFKSKLNISPYIAGLINLVITTLISYFGHKYISFRKHDINLKEYFMDMKKPKRIEWILLISFFVISFLLFEFSDLECTTTNGIHFIDLLFKGKVYSLYEVAYHGGTMITYDFPIFIIFGIWDIPLWIYQNITGKFWVDSTFGIFYAKAIIIPFLIGSLYYLKKIAKLYFDDENDVKLLKFLFLSSPLLLMVICEFAGYDILSIFFVLAGIYYYLKGDTKKFILFFSISITLKLFALFIFIPLVILKEKNIIKAGISMGLGVIPFLISKALFMNAPYYKESMTAFDDRMFDRLLYAKIPSEFGGISIFITLFVIICIISYMIKKEDFKKYTMIIPFMVYSLFEITVLQHPQWFILNVPYISFLILFNKRYINLKLILDIVYEYACLIICFISFPHVYTPQIMNHMLIGQLTHHICNFRFAGFIEVHNLRYFLPILNSVAVASVVALLYLVVTKNDKLHDDKQISRGLIWIRVLGMVPFFGIIVLTFFIR